MRISSAALGLAIVIAGCTRPPAEQALSNAADAAASDAGLIECAPAGARTFARLCGLDRSMTTRGLVLTTRNPDGGFHRLLVTRDGRGVIAADGAEAARVAIIGDGLIEVALGRDRYRLPATIGAKKAAP